MGGFALVKDNRITILVNEADFGSEINAKEAEANYLAAKNAVETNSDPKRKFELKSQFKRARVKFEFVQFSKRTL